MNLAPADYAVDEEYRNNLSFAYLVGELARFVPNLDEKSLDGALVR